MIDHLTKLADELPTAFVDNIKYSYLVHPVLGVAPISSSSFQDGEYNRFHHIIEPKKNGRTASRRPPIRPLGILH